MKKRMIALTLAVMMSLSLTACGGGGGAATAPAEPVAPGTVANTKPLTQERLAELDGTASTSEQATEPATEPEPTDAPAVEDADYSAVEAAIAKVPVDTSIYTDESVEALNKALGGVINGKTADEQASVDAMAKAIEDAIAGLVKKEPEGTTSSETEPAEQPEEPSIVAPDVTGETPSAEDKPVSELNPLTNTGYRFQDFVLRRAGTSNAVISGESLLTSMDMWREMVNEQDRQVMKKYISRDYLSFDSTDSLKLINRIWVDESLRVTAGDSRLSGMFESVNMSDPSATGTKNTWVSNETDGFISYTPTSFSDSTFMDMTSVAYLKDNWVNGSKPYDTKTRIFFNADGTETKTVMFRDEGLTYWELNNAVAYCMYLQNGNYAMFILPNRGTDLKDVDVLSLMTGKIPSKRAHVRFYMPEFAVESSYMLKMSNFSLPVGTVMSDLVAGLPSSYEPVFGQLAKVAVTKNGIGPSTGGEDLVLPATYTDDLDVISVICDRPFLYYIGDAENEDIAFFGVVNQITDDMAVTPEEAGISN